MKLLYSSADLIRASQLRDILEAEGIPALIRNDILAGLAPEIPFTESFPEVWIQNDADLARAEAIKNDWKGAANLAAAWTCSGCGERLEPQFSSCWKCGAQQPQADLA